MGAAERAGCIFISSRGRPGNTGGGAPPTPQIESANFGPIEELGTIGDQIRLSRFLSTAQRRRLWPLGVHLGRGVTQEVVADGLDVGAHQLDRTS